MSIDRLIAKFADKQVAEKYAKAAGEAKKQHKTTCFVDSAEWKVADIKNALLKSGNGEIGKTIWFRIGRIDMAKKVSWYDYTSRV